MNILFNDNQIYTGEKIVGSWNKQQYNIIRILGSGENGTVYLVESDNNEYALKMSNGTDDLNYEIQAIYRLSKAQGLNLGFSVFDIDDWSNGREIRPFYVMPYKKGITIKQYLYGKKPEEYLLVFTKVLKKLRLLHDIGWIFGDLKPEHILINPNTLEIFLIDFGGITRENEGVRQFTELYDRGSWKAGSRKADQHYDLFSLSIVFVSLNIGEKKLQKFLNQAKGIKDIYDIIRGIHNLKFLADIMNKIFRTSLITSSQAIIEAEDNRFSTKKTYRKKIPWLDLLFASSLLLFLAMFIFLIYSW